MSGKNHSCRLLLNHFVLVVFSLLIISVQNTYADDPQGLQLFGRVHGGIPLENGTNIPGEQIDSRKGELRLENLDIVIPGNGGLDIELYRQFMPNERIERSMEDWNISLPRITMSTGPGGGNKV